MSAGLSSKCSSRPMAVMFFGPQGHLSRGLRFDAGPLAKTLQGVPPQTCHGESQNAPPRAALCAGNVNFAVAREGLMSSELLGAELEQCFPLMEMAWNLRG